jgi:hypothetical protein
MSTITLYARKELSALPGVLAANTIYAIRRSTGFDLYITDNTGLIAHKLNNSDDPLKSPVFTYNTGKLTGITYSDGSTKILTYTGTQLMQIDLLRNGITTRKVFAYVGGVLSSVTETTL